jgi:hypothetical protein
MPTAGGSGTLVSANDLVVLASFYRRLLSISVV